jgi:hypothetical protein
MVVVFVGVVVTMVVVGVVEKLTVGLVNIGRSEVPFNGIILNLKRR